MNQHEHTNSRQASAPTPAEVAWLRVVTRENPGLRISFQHWQSDAASITAIARDKDGRIVCRQDGSDRLALVKAIREDMAAKRTPQGAGLKANAGGKDPAADYIRTGRTGAPARASSQKDANESSERERMLMRIRLAEAEL